VSNSREEFERNFPEAVGVSFNEGLKMYDPSVYGSPYNGKLNAIWQGWQAARPKFTALCHSKTKQIGSPVGYLVQNEAGALAAVHNLGRVTWLDDCVAGPVEKVASAQDGGEPEWESEAKRAFWSGLEIGSSMGSVAILPRWDEYIAKRKGEISARPPSAVVPEWLIQMRGDYLTTRGVWERADHRGYTNDINEAGRYTEEEAREAEQMLPEKCKAIRLPTARAQDGGKPVAWIRFTSTGGFEGPLHNCQIDDVRKASGAWTPLYPPSAVVPEWFNPHSTPPAHYQPVVGYHPEWIDSSNHAGVRECFTTGYGDVWLNSAWLEGADSYQTGKMVPLLWTHMPTPSKQEVIGDE